MKKWDLKIVISEDPQSTANVDFQKQSKEETQF